MDIKGAMRTRLLAAEPVTALLGGEPERRISWVERPEGAALPALTLQTVSGMRDRHMKDLQALRWTRVQIDAWGARFGDAQRLIEAAIAALEPAHRGNGISFRPATFENERDGTERLADETIYRTGIDLIVWFSPA